VKKAPPRGELGRGTQPAFFEGGAEEEAIIHQARDQNSCHREESDGKGKIVVILYARRERKTAHVSSLRFSTPRGVGGVGGLGLCVETEHDVRNH